MKNPDRIKEKIYNLESLTPQLYRWRFLGKKIVFTNGCFDILHAGHIDYLSRASDLGDILIIGINSDESVKRLKGNGRPLQNLNSRCMVLASLFYVDAVIPFAEDTPYELICSVKPEVLIKGGDYKEDEIVGADIVKLNDGIILTIPFLEGYSTTLIEEKIIRNNQLKE